MPTSVSISTARAEASRDVRPWWSCRLSPICAPTFRTGFSAVMGSWKIMLMRLPRMLRISASDKRRRSRSSKAMLPAVRTGGSVISLRIDIAVTDFPEPDSPTIARVSPSSTENETPSTARTTPSRVAICVLKLSTLSSDID
jgi:hypothetical protein